MNVPVEVWLEKREVSNTLEILAMEKKTFRS